MNKKIKQKANARNSANRANNNKERLHRIGSKPYGQVFKSKSRDSVVGYGGVKAKYIRGPSCTAVELEVELNAVRKKNEVLVDRVTTVETENENLRNCVESVEAEMGKFKDWASKQLNITIPPCTNTENGNPGLTTLAMGPKEMVTNLQLGEEIRA
ncbi:hypothetical protein Cgig2_004482 [Carnegiea gigantea]|uniref:Uncharacterized protein n=1 Tax=Carnegiea gigantea TaxID=171969 RepID=A0A9Q1JRF5_9CARY|nr:hypothetical protein Cgig2_004482 [Carnegiea gigantea]